MNRKSLILEFKKYEPLLKRFIHEFEANKQKYLEQIYLRAKSLLDFIQYEPNLYSATIEKLHTTYRTIKGILGIIVDLNELDKLIGSNDCIDSKSNDKDCYVVDVYQLDVSSISIGEGKLTRNKNVKQTAEKELTMDMHCAAPASTESFTSMALLENVNSLILQNSKDSTVTSTSVLTPNSNVLDNCKKIEQIVKRFKNKIASGGIPAAEISAKTTQANRIGKLSKEVVTASAASDLNNVKHTSGCCSQTKRKAMDLNTTHRLNNLKAELVPILRLFKPEAAKPEVNAIAERISAIMKKYDDTKRLTSNPESSDSTRKYAKVDDEKQSTLKCISNPKKLSPLIKRPPCTTSSAKVTISNDEQTKTKKPDGKRKRQRLVDQISDVKAKKPRQAWSSSNVMESSTAIDEAKTVKHHRENFEQAAVELPPIADNADCRSNVESTFQLSNGVAVDVSNLPACNFQHYDNIRIYHIPIVSAEQTVKVEPTDNDQQNTK